MDMTDITNKFNNKIYYVDGEPKSSVTTAIGKYTKPNLENWYKKNRDETFKQLQTKLAYHKAMSDEAYVLAEIELKKETSYQKQRRIITTLNRNNMYELPNAISQVSGRYSNRWWRQNGWS